MRPPLLIDTVATARAAARVRREFTAWLALDVAGEVLHDVVMAVYEAVANSAEHAYAEHPDGPGGLRLTAHRGHDAVQITVADDGIWRAPTGQPYRSRGLPLIGQLIEHVHVDRGSTGTVVHLRTPVQLPTEAVDGHERGR